MTARHLELTYPIKLWVCARWARLAMHPALRAMPGALLALLDVTL